MPSKYNLHQKDRESLYGVQCLHNKRLIIKTSENFNDGIEIQRTRAQEYNLEEFQIQLNKNKKVVMNKESLPDFYFACETEDCKRRGSLEYFEILKSFLPLTSKENPNKNFFGKGNNTEYEMVFKVYENYLVLFKASKNLEDLPYLEQTSLMKVDKDLKPTTKNDEDTLYMVPFVGYPLQRCVLESRLDLYGRPTLDPNVVCSDKSDSSFPYVQIDKNEQYYEYNRNQKVDLFPIKYFSKVAFTGEEDKGEWLFSETRLDNYTAALPDTSLKVAVPVRFHIETEEDDISLTLQNMSGDVPEKEREQITSFKIKPVDYKMDLSGDRFLSFGEKEDEEATNKNYILFFEDGFSHKALVESDQKIVNITFPLKLQKINIKRNQISYVASQGSLVRAKRFFIRKQAINQEGFIPKRWFKRRQ